MLLLRALTVLVAFVFMFAVLAGLVLPREVHVIRSTMIAAPPQDVFNYVNDLQRSVLWSPWSRQDPDALYNFTGPRSGVGATLSWFSKMPEVGSGMQQIVASRDGEHVRLRVRLDGMGDAVSDYYLQRRNNSTVVTWGFTTDLGPNPLSRIAGILFDGWIGPDYERGLALLKQQVEGNSKLSARAPLGLPPGVTLPAGDDNNLSGWPARAQEASVLQVRLQ